MQHSVFFLCPQYSICYVLQYEDLPLYHQFSPCDTSFSFLSTGGSLGLRSLTEGGIRATEFTQQFLNAENWKVPYNNFCFLARIQNLDANDKRPEQETDIISQESSIRSSTPRKNGSVLNFESPVSKGTRIQTISQSVPQAVPSTDVVRPANATPTTSTSLTPAPSVSSVQKPRNYHISNR